MQRATCGCDPISSREYKFVYISLNTLTKPVTVTLTELSRFLERSLHRLAGLAGLPGQHLLLESCDPAALESEKPDVNTFDYIASTCRLP